MRLFLMLALYMPGWCLAQDAAEFYRSGFALFTQNRPDEALLALDRCVALQPAHAPAWKAIGVIYAARQDYESAEQPFAKACELQPSLPDACIYYGRTLYLLDRFPAAIKVLRRALASSASKAQVYRLIGLSLEGSGDPAGAAEALETAVRLNGESAPNEDPGIDYGVFLYRQGHAGQAVEPLAAALKRHPNAARAHLELGDVLLALDRLPEAAGHLEQAVALDPSPARAHLLLGKVYLRMGRPQAAEEHLRLGAGAVK